VSANLVACALDASNMTAFVPGNHLHANMQAHMHRK